MPILTAKVGTNAEQFPEILELFVPPPAKILDMTFGNGVFWNLVNDSYDVWANDIHPEKGYFSYDFTEISRYINETFDAVVLDPPYMYHSSTSHKESLDRNYGNNRRVRRGIHGVDAIHEMYRQGMQEAIKLLVPRGILIVKCMDQIMSGKQYRQHIAVWEIATQELNLLDEDSFVMVQRGTPVMRHNYQIHARKNHSFWWVFRKRTEQ